ncbi:MAG: ATP-binding protein [Verrucomicrobiota bacterium]|nr:ATP-binding protein [Verrucomicrobiota bacterium]
MIHPIISLELRHENDVVIARQRARQISELLGFSAQDQARIATAVSELARNAFQYGERGKVFFEAQDEMPPQLLITVRDEGRGIEPERLSQILGGRYQSSTGMGLGLLGVHRLMKVVKIETAPGKGTVVEVMRPLPTRMTLGQTTIAGIRAQLQGAESHDTSSEIQRQNQELLLAMSELERRERDLSELNRELEDTNRGVVALYAELDERADYLRRASEIKTKFLSNMTHEFRTPVNSILSLSRLLLDRLDGPLTSEQEKQVNYIRRAAMDLSDLVNDLLDIAKVEAGKVTVKASSFSLNELFGALRGMLRPLVTNSAVSLIFEDTSSLPEIYTDESKLSQILRNFISNALKYTEKGEIRVAGRMNEEGKLVISVSDSGIGIAEQDLGRIFEEFVQVEGEHQRKVKGTGLGLPLARKLAELLGGMVEARSKAGEGSVFSVTIPIQYEQSRSREQKENEGKISSHLKPGQAGGKPVLVVEDEEAIRYFMKTRLESSGRTVLEAADGKAGLELAQAEKPGLIFLDLIMPGMDGGSVARQLRANLETKTIPIVLNTSRTLSDSERKELLQVCNEVVTKDWLVVGGPGNGMDAMLTRYLASGRESQNA